ncbi:hypothetical protein RDI58_014794 [Solanum bulbocastanum]|uniref:Uncharacterized protein n=1 Tax=Solanum bulbocastanum TaxID=147425 RepID=A0AAN8TE38_SOLBU
MSSIASYTCDYDMG